MVFRRWRRRSGEHAILGGCSWEGPDGEGGAGGGGGGGGSHGGGAVETAGAADRDGCGWETGVGVVGRAGAASVCEQATFIAAGPRLGPVAERAVGPSTGLGR